MIYNFQACVVPISLRWQINSVGKETEPLAAAQVYQGILLNFAFISIILEESSESLPVYPCCDKRSTAAKAVLYLLS